MNVNDQNITGMNVESGQALGGMAHLQQSISDILTTPIGSRVMRRAYGSRLFELVDQPANGVGRLRLMAATAEALTRWEPRLKLRRVTVDTTSDGQITVNISGETKAGDIFSGGVVL